MNSNRHALKTRTGPKLFFVLTIGVGFAAACSVLKAAPYASNVQVSGTTVNFILNEPADSLLYSINGGTPVPLDHTTKGGKTFNLNLATDTFSIIAEKNATIGFTIPTGGTVANHANGLSLTSNAGGLSVISDDDSLLTRFVNLRGVDVSRNPNAPNFGTAYIAHSTPATTGTGRNVGRGMYALRADGSDAFGYGDTAQNPFNINDFPNQFESFIVSANSPFRVFVAESGWVYVADWSDANGNVFELDPTLTESRNLLAGYGGTSTNIGDGRTHGSIASAYVTGSRATNDLVLYSMDEDLNTGSLAQSTPTNDRNSIWKYELGSSTDSNVQPTRIATGLIGDVPGGGIIVDFDFGADGKIYMSQHRAQNATLPGILVVEPNGTVVFNSLQATRTLLDDPAAFDIFSNVFGGITVSPDQKWLAGILNNGHIVVMPLEDGIPDIEARLVIETATPVISSRGIAFDAANNLHYVSSGQQRYRQLAPGGHTVATLSWDGSEYAFDLQTISDPGLIGDHNGDGTVDAADYVLWRSNPGAYGGDPGGYDAWRANFGMGSPGAGGGSLARVPEPAAATLCLLGLIASLAIRRANR